MAKKDQMELVQNDTEVAHEKYGAGKILSSEYVEKPSDGDHTFYRVQMEDGSIRHLKASEFTEK